MAVKTWPLNQGLNTAADRSMVRQGELQTAIGAYYKPGDAQRLWKLAGRSSYGTLASAERIATIALFKYDTAANDKLVVYSADGTIHTSALTTATTGSFTTLTTGLNTNGQLMGWVHYDDVWYLGNGVDSCYAYESDGTFRLMGMQQPSGGISGTSAAGTNAQRASVAAGSDWTDKSKVLNLDKDDFTYCVTWLADDGPFPLELSSFGANTETGRVLSIKMSMDTAAPTDGSGLAPTPSATFDQTIKIEYDDGTGGGYITVYNVTTRKPKALGTFTYAIPDTIDTASMKVKITFTANRVLFNPRTTLRVYDCRFTDAGVAGDFTPDFGFFYAYSEYDSTRALESAYVSTDKPITFASGNSVTLTLPSAAVNPLADTWRIYRTHDGGQIPGDLRMIAEIPIAESTFLDTFDYDKDTPGTRVPEFLKVQVTESVAQYYPSNLPPPALQEMVEYQNFVVGLGEDNPRTLYYSLPAFPESWPEIYQITDFPLEEHDQLRALAVAGDLLIVGAKEAIIVINGLPEVDAQAYSGANMTALKGAPGCVGRLAMAAYSLGGEPRVAWISKFGVYETNGHQVWELTHPIDFPALVGENLSKAALYWDKEDQLLYACYDSGADGYNDRFLTLHMSDDHRKDGRGTPKTTGPHYGQLSNVIGGVISADSAYHMYSSDAAATGKVFNEKSGGTDASNAYTTTSVLPLDVKTGRNFSEDLVEWAVDFPTVRHSSWGATPVAITWTFGRDDIGETAAVVNTITMSSQKATKFAVARSGEWAEIRIVHEGDTVTGNIVHIQADAQVMGESGDTKDS
jgi:hypothetical protein